MLNISKIYFEIENNLKLVKHLQIHSKGPYLNLRFQKIVKEINIIHMNKVINN